MDFNHHDRDTDVNSPEAKMALFDAISRSVAHKAAEEIGSRKLGAAFKVREKTFTETGFGELLNFTCLLASKPPEWEQVLARAIERTDKNAYYLSSMLSALMLDLRDEVNRSADRDHAKRLVAHVRAKRDFNKQVPGNKAVTRMLDFLTRTNQFEDKREPEA